MREKKVFNIDNHCLKEQKQNLIYKTKIILHFLFSGARCTSVSHASRHYTDLKVHCSKLIDPGRNFLAMSTSNGVKAISSITAFLARLSEDNIRPLISSSLPRVAATLPVSQPRLCPLPLQPFFVLPSLCSSSVQPLASGLSVSSSLPAQAHNQVHIRGISLREVLISESSRDNPILLTYILRAPF